MFKSNRKMIILVVGVMMLMSTSSFGEVYNLQNYNYNSQYYRVNNWTPNNNYNTPSWNYNYNWGVIVPPVKPNKPSIPTVPTVPEKPVTPPVVEKPVTPPVVEKPVTPTPPTENVTGLSANEMEVVRLVNIERQKAGLSNFRASSELSNVARAKSKDMAVNNYFSHTSPTYGSPFEMMKSFGISYRTAGENIAKGYSSAESVVRGWMNSQGHRDNILNPSFNTIGVGAYNGNGSTYWTQMFTN
jgi:uncharacterized YkwD family protein